MREILFRGKRTDNGEWVYGDLLHPDDCGNGYAIEDFTKEKNNCFDVIPDTIGQYTGLTDKNGKKIFEGDILRINYYPKDDVIIEWHDGAFRFKKAKFPRAYEYEHLCVNQQSVRYRRIIGNIHDNPELLEV